MLTCLICLELAPRASNFALTRLENVKNSINSNSLLKDLDFFLLANYLPNLMTPKTPDSDPACLRIGSDRVASLPAGGGRCGTSFYVSSPARWVPEYATMGAP
jgi:hypothetical protein